MSKSIILTPALSEASLIPNALLDGQDLTGKTVLEVDDEFTWLGKCVDWETLTIVDDLTAIKQAAIDRVNTEAEAFRMLFLTPGSGQAATYLRKETEARAWVSGSDPATVPFLACEASATDTSIGDVAALVIAQADAWIAMGSQIEGLRRGASVAITAASTMAAIDTAATIDWNALLG